MTDSKLVISELTDGTFVAASTASPFFCTVGESAAAVRERAERAAQFYRRAVATPVTVESHITQFEHAAPREVEAWLSDTEMNVA